MRIAYGIHGYGRGHATRALAVLPELARRHDLLILAGGDAYDATFEQYPVLRIPTLGYHYRQSGTRSNYLTFTRNAPAVLDVFLHGPAFQMIEDAFRDFRPNVVVADAEPWTHAVAAHTRVPRIGFDHFGVLAYCRPAMNWSDRIVAERDAWVYRKLMGQPERVIVSSFYDAPPRRDGVTFVGTLLRDEVFRVRSERGEFLLAYFNKGVHLFSRRVEQALLDCGSPVKVYGTGRRGTDRNLEFCPPSNIAFLEDLAACRAVISTAGNQLVGEAVHFGKPMLVMPEDCVEQRVNARALEEMGIGMQVSQRNMSVSVVRDFLAQLARFESAIRRASRDGRRESIAAIERFAHELTGIAPATAQESAARVA